MALYEEILKFPEFGCGPADAVSTSAPFSAPIALHFAKKTLKNQIKKSQLSIICLNFGLIRRAR